MNISVSVCSRPCFQLFGIYARLGMANSANLLFTFAFFFFYYSHIWSFKCWSALCDWCQQQPFPYLSLLHPVFRVHTSDALAICTTFYISKWLFTGFLHYLIYCFLTMEYEVFHTTEWLKWAHNKSSCPCLYDPDQETGITSLPFDLGRALWLALNDRISGCDASKTMWRQPSPLLLPLWGSALRCSQRQAQSYPQKCDSSRETQRHCVLAGAFRLASHQPAPVLTMNVKPSCVVCPPRVPQVTWLKECPSECSPIAKPCAGETAAVLNHWEQCAPPKEISDMTFHHSLVCLPLCLPCIW